MKNKLLFLTKMSLNKKIKTKWFLIANFVFAFLIIGLINIDSVIKFFGGDFDEAREILVIDEENAFDAFKVNYEMLQKYVEDYDSVIFTLYDGEYLDAVREVEEEDKVLT